MLLYLVSILGLALLMVVHEAGHMAAARAFGLRVTTFSIGFGPTIFKIEPRSGYFWFTLLAGKVRLRLHKHDPEKHGPTVYQVAIIPFLAYVQIAGMNPFDEIDPDDKGSYANASLFGRISTIFAGPLANYLFASVFFFFGFFYGGDYRKDDNGAWQTYVDVVAGDPASQAGLQDGDRIVGVDDVEFSTWDKMAEIIRKHPEEQISVSVERDDKRLSFEVTPKTGKKGQGLIGVVPKRMEVTASEAAVLAVTSPPAVVRDLVVGLAKLISGEVEAELTGPAGIVKAGVTAVRHSFWSWLRLLGTLSAYLGAFNLIPFPALDGGRLMFLGYELATRRRPNAKVEAHIHIIGLVMLLGLVLWVTLFNDFGLGGGK